MTEHYPTHTRQSDEIRQLRFQLSLLQKRHEAVQTGFSDAQLLSVARLHGAELAILLHPEVKIGTFHRAVIGLMRGLLNSTATPQVQDKRLIGQLRAVVARDHTKVPSSNQFLPPRCRCGQPWPCSTLQLLDDPRSAEEVPDGRAAEPA